MLLLSSELISGVRWVYTYSVAPGVVVRLVVEPGPNVPAADHPSYAEIVLAAVAHYDG